MHAMKAWYKAMNPLMFPILFIEEILQKTNKEYNISHRVHPITIGNDLIG